MVRAQGARLNESKDQPKGQLQLDPNLDISQKSAILRFFSKYTDNPWQLEWYDERGTQHHAG